jgi:hypothetical protein
VDSILNAYLIKIKMEFKTVEPVCHTSINKVNDSTYIQRNNTGNYLSSLSIYTNKNRAKEYFNILCGGKCEQDGPRDHITEDDISISINPVGYDYLKNKCLAPKFYRKSAVLYLNSRHICPEGK